MNRRYYLIVPMFLLITDLFILGGLTSIFTSGGLMLSAHAEDAKQIKVALYDASGTSGKGVSCVCTELGKYPGITVTKVKPDQIRADTLTNFDVVVFTGGSAGAQAKALGSIGRDKVKQFVERGGGYMGICAGAYLAMNGFDWGIPVLDADLVSEKWERGEGNVKIELTAKGHEILHDTNQLFEVHYENGPLLKPAKSGKLPDFETLAVFRTELAGHGSPVGAMVNTPAIVSGTCGKGRVIVISPHPEQSKGLEHFISDSIRWMATRPQ